MEPHDTPLPLPLFSWAARSESQYSSAKHSHSGQELVYTLSGYSTIQTGEVALEAFPRALLVLPAEIPHTHICHEPTDRFYMIFHASPQWLDETPRVVSLHDEEWIPRWLEELSDLCANQSHPGATARCAQGLLMAVLHRLHLLEEQRHQQRNLHPAVRQSTLWIENHLTDALSLQTIATHVGLSGSHLTSLFHESLGTSPMKHVQNRRMALAKRLLIDPYRTVSQVADLCGYDDANYFTRLFRKCHGLSPTEYRLRAERETAHCPTQARRD